MSDVKIFNNFENLFEVTGRDFKTFKRNLMQVPHPCQEVQYGVKPSGAFYAILRMDRPVKENPKKKAKKLEQVNQTKTEAAG